MYKWVPSIDGKSCCTISAVFNYIVLQLKELFLTLIWKIHDQTYRRIWLETIAFLSCTRFEGDVPFQISTAIKLKFSCVHWGPPWAGLDPGKTIFSGTPAIADQLKIYTLNRKDGLQWLGLGLKQLICTTHKNWHYWERKKLKQHGRTPRICTCYPSLATALPLISLAASTLSSLAVS
jgi:hypothetical protein